MKEIKFLLIGESLGLRMIINGGIEFLNYLVIMNLMIYNYY